MPLSARLVAAAFAALGLMLPRGAEASPCHLFAEAPAAAALLGEARADAASAARIVYVGHSTFRIESPGGVVIATDYFGAAGPGRLPDVVTMNHAHETHYTDFPDPRIPHVLRGWNPAGDGPAEHYLRLGDVTIRNVTTDIRGWGSPEKDGNSIFIFEIGDLCIGHVGHLHHAPTEEQYARIGRLDVVMVPVDGTYTLPIEAMVRVVRRLRARIVLPMHVFHPASLARFLAGLGDVFDVVIARERAVTISRDSLPEHPTVLVLTGDLPPAAE